MPIQDTLPILKEIKKMLEEIRDFNLLTEADKTVFRLQEIRDENRKKD